MNTDLNQDELRALMAKATSGPYIAVDADGTPCVGRVNADLSGGKGFLVAEGWSLSDCEYVAAALNALPGLLDKLDELAAAALRAEQAAGDEQRARELLAEMLGSMGRKFEVTAGCVRAGDYDKVIRRALGTARQSEGVVPCEWEQQDRGSDWISTDCGDEFVLTDASDYDDGAQVFKHCPYCAAPAVFRKWKTDNEAMLAAAPGGEGER